MDYANWAVIGSIATAAGVAVLLLVHIIRYAYQHGVTDNRLSTLEKASETAVGVQGVLATLTANVGALQASIARLDNAVEHIGEKISRVSSRS